MATTDPMLRHVIQDGRVYLDAEDLALVFDTRGQNAFHYDNGGYNGRVIKNSFHEVSNFIRRVAQDRSTR